MNAHAADDKRSIAAVVEAFFRVFDNRNGITPALDALYELCIAECVIVKAVAGEPTIYSLCDFIEPRARLLKGGGLVDFFEEEVWESTDQFGMWLSAFARTASPACSPASVSPRTE